MDGTITMNILQKKIQEKIVNLPAQKIPLNEFRMTIMRTQITKADANQIIKQLERSGHIERNQKFIRVRR